MPLSDRRAGRNGFGSPIGKDSKDTIPWRAGGNRITGEPPGPVGFGGVLADVAAGPGASPFSGLAAEAGPAGGEGLSLDRVKVLAGRLFDPADPHAVMISQQVADREHLRPGGTLDLIGYPQRDGNPDVKHEVRLAFRVSAVVAFNDQIVAASYLRLLLSPAFARTRQAMSFNPGGGGIYVLLRPRAEG